MMLSTIGAFSQRIDIDLLRKTTRVSICHQRRQLQLTEIKLSKYWLDSKYFQQFFSFLEIQMQPFSWFFKQFLGFCFTLTHILLPTKMKKPRNSNLKMRVIHWPKDQFSRSERRKMTTLRRNVWSNFNSHWWFWADFWWCSARKNSGHQATWEDSKEESEEVSEH